MEQTLSLLLNNAQQPPASSINNLLKRAVSGDLPLGPNHDFERYLCVCVGVCARVCFIDKKATIIFEARKSPRAAAEKHFKPESCYFALPQFNEFFSKSKYVIICFYILFLKVNKIFQAFFFYSWL